MAPPPALMDDVVDEILLRLPPADPACLARASLVCKRWRRLLSGPAFRRRYRLFHGKPLLLGFIHVLKGSPPYASRFVSTSDHGPATRDLPGWLVLDCRHGRALFATASPNVGSRRAVDLVVWNPTTNEQHRLSPPSTSPDLAVQHFNAAVLCAAGEGCDHTDCHGGPFRVVFIFTSTRYTQTVTSALVYSSQSGAWGDLTSIHLPHCQAYVDVMPSVLVGDTLYFSCGSKYIFEYQLGVSRLSAISAPAHFHGTLLVIIKGEKGVLEFTDIQLSGSSIHVWAREVSASGAGAWVQCRSIKLKTLLPDGALPTNVDSRFMARVSGFIEGTDVIFVGTSGNTYMVQLKSRRITELALPSGRVVPYADFYIPAMRAASTGDTPRAGSSFFSNLKRRCFKYMTNSSCLSKVF
ncbi:unnamed protein product [Alopecurus aequalis]